MYVYLEHGNTHIVVEGKNTCVIAVLSKFWWLNDTTHTSTPIIQHVLSAGPLSCMFHGCHPTNPHSSPIRYVLLLHPQFIDGETKAGRGE